MEPPPRQKVVVLRFTGGPWDGRELASNDPPHWFRIDGERSYELTGYTQNPSGVSPRYTWDDGAPKQPAW